MRDNISTLNPTLNPKNTYAAIFETRRANYERALALDFRLLHVDTAVRLATMFIRRTDEMCYGCAWELAFKRLILHLVGWGRGVIPANAADPAPEGATPNIGSRTLADLKPPPRTNAETESEQWLRTEEAYDAVAFAVLYQLYEADPGHGCGFHRGRRSVSQSA